MMTSFLGYRRRSCCPHGRRLPCKFQVSDSMDHRYWGSRGLPSRTTAYFALIGRGVGLLGRRERRSALVLILAGLVASLLDAVALLLLIPLLALLSGDPLEGVWGASWVVQGAGDRLEQAAVLGGLVAALFIVRSAVSICTTWWSFGVGNGVEMDLVQRLIASNNALPQVARLRRNSAELQRNVVVGTAQIGVLVGSGIGAVADLILLLLLAGVVLIADPLVGMLVLVYFALASLVWVRAARPRLERAGSQTMRMAEGQLRAVAEGAAAAKELELRGRATAYASNALLFTARKVAAERVARTIAYSQRYVFEVILVTGILAVVVVASLVGQGDSLLILLGLIAAAAFRMLPAVGRVLAFVNESRYVESALAGIETELREGDAAQKERGAQGSPAPLPLPSAQCPLLELRDVSFSYSPDLAPALEDVSLVLGEGESIGVVGPTGAGKSTLLDIVLGIHAPTRGGAYARGVPLQRCRTAWQRSIGYVAQDTVLIDDSIAMNVALGWAEDEIDSRRLWAALEAADLAGFVLELPAREKTTIGERGFRLSGGQRQRLGLARALYIEPQVLILDEATSSLDTQTESRIVDRIAALHGQVASLVVAHRLSTVRDCDLIVFIRAGRVCGKGTFDELLAENAEFRSFVHAQPGQRPAKASSVDQPFQ